MNSTPSLTKALTKASPYLRVRALWAAVFALAALILRVASPSPPPRTADGVAAMLGAAVGGEVRADDFVWEARGGFWSDAFLGRWVLFLARRPGPLAADLYRARVRLTRAGQPIGLGLVRNLTRSPLGDDRELVALGHHAAYVTGAFGAVQGVTLLDLAGEGDAREARGRLDTAAAAVESWLTTGSTRGIGRTEVTFETALFRQHLKQPPPPFAERAPGAAVPPALEAVVKKLLEKDPAARYQSAEELGEALDDAVPEAGIAPEPIHSGAPSAPRSRPSAKADPLEIAPPSDASPPPAPAVHSAAGVRAPKRGAGSARSSSRWRSSAERARRGSSASSTVPRPRSTMGGSRAPSGRCRPPNPRRPRRLPCPPRIRRR